MLIGLKAVRLAIEHGNAPKSPYFYGNYGIINNATGGELDVSYRFAQLGIDLVDKAGYTEIEGATHFLFGAFNCHWRRPISLRASSTCATAVKAAWRAGAYLHVAWAAMIGMYYRFYRGENIQELLADVPANDGASCAGPENPVAQTLLTVFEQNLKAFSGATGSPTSLDGDGFDEAAFSQRPRRSACLQVYYHVLKQPLVFLAGDFQRSLELAEAALPLMPGMYFVTEHALYRTLARAALLADETGDAAPRPRAAAQGGGDLPHLGRGVPGEPRASACPRRGGDRGAGRRARPGDRSLRSGDQARARERLHPARGAGQRAGGEVPSPQAADPGRPRLHARGLVRVPAVGREGQGASSWASATPTSSVASRPAAAPQARRSRPPAPRHSAPPIRRAGLELVTAVRATQALAGELELGNLLERLMRVMVENAGAQKGILVLNHGGQLEVEALVTVEPYRIQLGLRQPIEQSTELAASVVQYVARSKETVVLENAAADARFARDRYIASRRPKSLLCLAMLHQGRLVGVLYLENNAATNAFSAERVEILQLVAAQAAVAVENATLYGELRSATEQLRRANDTLEAQVARADRRAAPHAGGAWSEMDLARKIQTVLLPNETRFRDYEVSAMMVPASTVGGDYYDIIRTDGVRLGADRRRVRARRHRRADDDDDPDGDPDRRAERRRGRARS